MDIIVILKLMTALGIFNVWILRCNQATEFRGGKSKSLKEEFKAYGLNIWFMYVIGLIKILISVLFIVSFFIADMSTLDLYGSAIMSTIMIGAILMHLKLKDPIKKSIPAITMFTMYSIIFLNYIL